MASTPDIQLVPLDFDRVRADLQRFLQNRSEFQDYNFQGSALSLLIDILAYDAYYHGWYTNFAINEVFLQTAQLRNSVVAAAKQVGYIPRSTTGSRAEVNITIGNVNPGEGTLLLPKYTRFESNASGTVFNFYTLDDTVVYPDGADTVTMTGVELCEGTLLSQTYDITEQNRNTTGTTLRVLNTNVDTTTMTVLVRPSSTSPMTFEYTRATSAVTVNATSNVYFLFETNAGDYEIQFGDDRLGRNLSLGQRVTIQYLVSRGQASTGASTFTYKGGGLGAVSETSNVSVVLSNINIPAHGGAERESIASIKRLAPNIYQTQGRVVTADDARAVLLSEVSGIDSLTVWGGEDHDPPTYGKMFLCLKPVDAERFGPTQKANIIQRVLRPKASPILSFEAVDPDYIYVVADTEVRYTPAKTGLPVQELQQAVRLAMEDYARVQLGQFGSYFRYSQLSSAIDDAEISVVSNMTSILLEKRLRILEGVSTYTVKFANPIFHSTQYAQPGTISVGAVSVTSKVNSQLFSHVDEAGVLQKQCWIQNDVQTAQAGKIFVEYLHGKTDQSLISTQKLISVLDLSRPESPSESAVLIYLKTQHPNEKINLINIDFLADESSIINDTAIHVYKTGTDNNLLKVKSNVGSIDFETGTITFTTFSPKAISTNRISELRIRAIPLNSDIAPNRDQIILLPTDNITITLVNDLLNRRNVTYGRSSGGGQLGSGSFGV